MSVGGAVEREGRADVDLEIPGVEVLRGLVEDATLALPVLRGRTRVTAAPIALTTPAPSQPRMAGSAPPIVPDERSL